MGLPGGSALGFGSGTSVRASQQMATGFSGRVPCRWAPGEGRERPLRLSASASPAPAGPPHGSRVAREGGLTQEAREGQWGPSPVVLDGVV